MIIKRVLVQSFFVSTAVLPALVAGPAIAAGRDKANAAAQSGEPAAHTASSGATSSGDIVVTARRRSESLIRVPVTVTAISEEQLRRYKTDSLEKVAELTPGVVIGQTKQAAGGSIAVRGISSSPSTVGFEQSVMLDLDGIPLSNGRAVALGLLDLQRVEILKGPQALLFGKNNTAGVISLISADPTPQLSGYARAGYEFIADETTLEGAISGPVSDKVGIRLALRTRKSIGWMYNDARATANPFFPAYPLQDPKHRLGDRETTGRITVKIKPSSQFTATFKLLASHMTDDGFGESQQAIGPCATGHPSDFGVVDPLGECRADNHTTAGLPNATILANGPDPKGSHGLLNALIPSLNLVYDFGPATLTSTSGYVYWKSEAAGPGSATTYAQLFGSEPQTLKKFSQEVRLLTHFSSPLNFMIGGFYEHTNFDYQQNVKLIDSRSFNPANGLFIAWLRPGYTHGTAYSGFGQLIYSPTEKFEVAGGARWTHEKKDSFSINTYAHFPGFPQGKSLSSNYAESNLSPEATISYHPTPRSTIYAAYRTGFKSGGFALSGTIQTKTLASDLAYRSEKARGFEAGAKGYLLHGLLQLQASVYKYKYTDLQVTTYNPASISYTFSNAARLSQSGFDLSAFLQPTPSLQIRGAINYNRNRFGGRYNGPCYGAQTAAQGCNILPGPAQDLSKRPPARSPDWAGNVGTTLDIPMGSRFKMNLNGDAFYTSSYFASETLDPYTLQRAFWRFNAGVRVMSNDDKWEVGLIGRNLTNKYYLLQAQDKTGGAAGEQKGSVARGREILVQLSTKF